MTYDSRPPRDSPPATENPAPQPKPPTSGSTCTPIPPTTPPLLDRPKAHDPDPYCKGPTKPGTNPNCLEELIAEQTAEIANREKAAKLKDELGELLKQARAVSQAYTRSKYDDMVKAWIEQDVIIAQLIARFVCIVPCWRCVIERHVCPLLSQLDWAEKWLYDNEKHYTDVHNLYDLEYWHTRDKQIKDRRLARIEKVLTAWTKPGPAATIEATLKANEDLAAAISDVLGTDPSKGIYDLFFKLIPRHLAVAPPAGVARTKIDQEYTVFCTCDAREADDCCGPDVGRLTLRQRLVGPLPYLIDPTEYFSLVCVIIEKRFHPAKEAAWKAEMDLTAIMARIASLVAQLGPTWPTTFETDAKGAIPGVIDCCDYDPREGGSRS
jgi:hypothetical protein